MRRRPLSSSPDCGYCCLRDGKRTGLPPLLPGIALGLAFGIRPLPVAAVAVPLAAVLVRDLVALRDRDSRNRIIGWIVGGAAAALPTLAANHLITGNALTFPYTLAKGSMYFAANLPFGIRNLDVLLYSSGTLLHGWGWPQLYGSFWVALALRIRAGAVSSPPATRPRMCCWRRWWCRWS